MWSGTISERSTTTAVLTLPLWGMPRAQSRNGGTPLSPRPKLGAASQLGSEHGELAAWRGRVEAVLDQPSAGYQASQRPPCADHIEVDVGAVPREHVAQVLLVSQCQDG